METPSYPCPEDLDHLVRILGSFTNYEKNRDFHKGRIRYDLKNMEGLCEAAGDPHLAMPCIHITGSKGKGSTAWMLTRILQALGLKTGTYTSPHLECMTERIAIDGRPLSEKAFLAAADRALDLLRQDPKLQTTFFEFITLTAMMAFAGHEVDVAVYEVGLGGRLDCTNVVRPEVSVITTVELEHCAVLGATEEEIALEKAGIIKQGIPVVTGLLESAPARAVVEEQARRRDAPVFGPGRGLETREHGDSRISIELGKETLGPYRAPRPLTLQASNLACAASAAFLFAQRREIAWNDPAVQASMENFALQGRFERVGERPTVILDGAHTFRSISAVVDEAAELGGGPPIVIIGLAEDKEVERIVSEVSRSSREIIFTSYRGGRAVPPETLRSMANGKGRVASHVEEALSKARETACEGAVVLITGSFYLAGEARKVILS